MSADFSAAEIAEAERNLRGGYLVIEPRLMGVPKDARCEEGRVLSQWKDGGFGDVVAHCKQVAGSFSDELVSAAVDMVRVWNPLPAPAWVCCVPSTRSQNLVPDFARRLAGQLGLPFHDVITKSRATESQKKMQNSKFQQSNVEGAFMCNGKVPQGPVLLVDDLVDSRWTFAEVGKVLRHAGAVCVYPLALAKTQPRRDS